MWQMTRQFYKPNAATILLVVSVLVAPTVSAQTFTDDPIVPGVTTIKSIHVTELRAAVDALRVQGGLQPSSWTDPTLNSGVTIVRAVHITELRARLNEALVAIGYSTQPYTDPSLASGFTVNAVHIAELRSRVAAGNACS